jgi:Bacterial conjugation TrbI-like protein
MQENNVTQSYESDTNWDEASLAQLLGFYDKSELKNPIYSIEETSIGSVVAKSVIEEYTHNAIATHELFDDPQTGKTQPTFYGNPFAKFGAVGLVMLVVFGAGATVLNSIMFGKPRVASTIANQEADKPKVEIADNANPQETETGKLKAELALGSQAEKMQSLEHSQSPKTTIQRKVSHRNDSNNRINRRISDAEVRPAQVSSVRNPIQESSRYNLPRVTSVPRFQATIKAAPPNTKESVDPIEEWEKISRLGSYGNTQIASITNEPANGKTLDTIANEQPNSSINIPSATLVSTVSPQSIEPEPLYTEEAAVINGKPIQQLQVGASASGKLVTPLIWAKRQSNNTSNKSQTTTSVEKFVIQLIEPLTKENGLIALPKGSQIVAQVTDIQKSGLVQLEATQVLIDGKEYLIPPRAISIRGNSGQPLIASKWSDKGGEIASRDAETFVVGSLAKVGKVLNQPKSQQISTSSGLGGTNTFSSISGSSKNILGAVLEGGFEPLTQQILQRNQQALLEIQQREEVWYIRAGTDIQVFVNQSFQL